MTDDPGTFGCPDRDALKLLNVMPVALFVIDASARVVFANDRLVDLLGLPREDLVGRSALDFIDERDVGFTASLLAAGLEFSGTVMGPSRIRYVDAAGVCHHTQFWAYETPPELGVEGYIVTLTPESVRDVLATAISAVASDDPVDRTLGAIATAGRAAPLDGLGTILVAESTAAPDDECFRVVGDWPLTPELVNSLGTPWRRCLAQGVSQDVLDCGVGGLDPGTSAEMTVAGLPAAWVRPVFALDGAVVAVYIVWRRTQGDASVNQEVHLDETVRLAHLALEQARHRRELELAAHRDALTGVGNRTSLNERVATERDHRAVLFIDLDHFKTVNDKFGHDVGDEVVAQVGRRLTDAVRRSDSVYRTGGDEFVVVCAADDSDDLIALAHRIVERITAPFDCRNHRVRIGASVGVASGYSAPGVPRSLQETIIAADRAMYVAKQRGRGRVHHADEPADWRA